jgi:hypothetical protein
VADKFISNLNSTVSILHSTYKQGSADLDGVSAATYSLVSKSPVAEMASDLSVRLPVLLKLTAGKEDAIAEV